MTNNDTRINQSSKVKNLSLIVQKRNEINLAIEQYNVAIEQYKVENPGVDVEAILSNQKELLPMLGQLPNRELDKFIARAKGQGTEMPFNEIEMGVLTAGRQDMQNGLAEILDSIKFSNPVCSECNDGMDNNDRGKKKL